MAAIADNAANAITAKRSKKLVNPLPIMKSRKIETNREWTPSNANQPNPARSRPAIRSRSCSYFLICSDVNALRISM